MPTPPTYTMASTNEIWLTDFGDPHPGEPAHHRPALIVGPSATFHREFPFVIVCPFTTTRRELPLHLEVEGSGTTGLAVTSYIQCELIHSIITDRLIHRLGTIDHTTKAAVDEIVDTLLGR